MSNIAPPLKLANRRWHPYVVLSGVVLFAALLSTPRLHRAAWTASNAVPPASSPKNEMPSPQQSFAVDQSPVSLHNGLMSAELKSATPSPSRSKAQATDERKIVRPATLKLSVKSPADAAEQIRQMAESMGGYLESAQTGGSKDAPVASVTIRVPAARFEDAKASIRNLP